MIQLTPLDKTAAGQELIRMGVLKGLEEGIIKGIKEGKEEGKKEGKKETALNLLQMNLLTADQIAKATGLRLSEVKKLKEKMRESR